MTDESPTFDEYNFIDVSLINVSLIDVSLNIAKLVTKTLHITENIPLKVSLLTRQMVIILLDTMVTKYDLY